MWFVVNFYNTIFQRIKQANTSSQNDRRWPTNAALVLLPLDMQKNLFFKRRLGKILREEQAEYGQAIVETLSRHSQENKSAPLKKLAQKMTNITDREEKIKP